MRYWDSISASCDLRFLGAKAESATGGPVGSISTNFCEVGFPNARSRALKCKLCNETATSPNPLRMGRGASLEPDPLYGGHRPWAKYNSETVDGVKIKVPAGKLCLLCLNCYRQLGRALSPCDRPDFGASDTPLTPLWDYGKGAGNG